MATDLDLTGEQRRDLQAALVAAFPDRFAFRQLTQHRLEIDLDTIVGDVGLLQVAFDLIEWASAQGRLRALVTAARTENPGNPELEALARRLGVERQDPIVAPGPADANRGLSALGDLMSARDAREAVHAFEAEFQEAVAQIDILAVFKDVHDLLHTLQFRCFDGLAREATRFPGDELSREIVNEHGMTLDETILKLEAVATHRAFDGAAPRWIEDLRAARAQVAEALDTSTAPPLLSAVRLLDRVLAVQPTRINTRLNDAARALQLRDLVGNLSQVHQRLCASGLDAAKLAEFDVGIKSLEQLERALRQLVAEHDRWQELEVELRLERVALMADAAALGSSWPRLRTLIVPLCSGPEAWATRLTADCGRLDAALAAGSPAQQRASFLLVHSQAATRFYQVDIALQQLCETLRQIGKPLSELLRRLP
jgi:hypothetical protein